MPGYIVSMSSQYQYQAGNNYRSRFTHIAIQHLRNKKDYTNGITVLTLHSETGQRG
jgi:hypothetical protein